MQLLLATLLLTALGDSNPGAPADTTRPLDRFAVHGYGALTYAAFDWDTDPGRRNAFDVERLVVYPSYRFSDKVRALAEVEVEHGGTGVTMEFDRFEEFGEFEQEVEKGGEVVLEQLHVEFALADVFGLRVGRFKLPIGLAARHDEPGEYFTTTRSEAESNLIPTNWYEVGVQAYGGLQLGAAGRLAYVFSLINGLDSSGFSSASWIVRGYQTRFETINADDLAATLTLDWLPTDDDDTRVGASVYYGGSAGNRPKPDAVTRADVFIAEGHAAVEAGPLTARALVLYGHLQNADVVSTANRNLSNALNVKRTPVGSAALGTIAEAGIDVFDVAGVRSHELVLFGRYEFYDTMYRTTGNVFDNPLWARTVYTGGVNWEPVDDIVFKAQYSHRVLGQAENRFENTFSLGLGFEFGEED